MPVVKMRVSLAGVNFSYAPGDLVTVNDEVAAEWVRIGHAEPVEQPPDDDKPKRSKSKN